MVFFQFIRAYWYSSLTLVKTFQFATGTSIAFHNIEYSKISLLTAQISIHNFDIICLSETHLTSALDIKNGNLKIPGYYHVSH